MCAMDQFDEFRGLTHDEFMDQLDKILVVSLDKLRDASNLHRRVMLFPTFEKIIKYRKVELLTSEEQEETF